MKHILLALAIVCSQLSFAQNTYRAIVKDERTQQVLTGTTAQIQTLDISAATDSNGVLELKNISNGNYQIKLSYIGHQDFMKTISFPLANPNKIFTIDLEPAKTELDEVIIQTTRSSRSIQDLPTRVEAITLKELNEKKFNEARRHPYAFERKYRYCHAANFSRKRYCQHSHSGA